MSKKAKLLEKLRSAKQLLTNAGFVHDLGVGSHQVYRHPDGRRMVLTRHGKDVKPYLIRQIRDLLK